MRSSCAFYLRTRPSSSGSSRCGSIGLALASASPAMTSIHGGGLVHRILSLCETCDQTAVKPRSLDRMVKAGIFPQPVQPSAGRLGWVESEVQHWIADRIAARDERRDPAADPVLAATAGKRGVEWLRQKRAARDQKRDPGAVAPTPAAAATPQGSATRSTRQSSPPVSTRRASTCARTSRCWSGRSRRGRPAWRAAALALPHQALRPGRTAGRRSLLRHLQATCSYSHRRALRQGRAARLRRSHRERQRRASRPPASRRPHRPRATSHRAP